MLIVTVGVMVNFPMPVFAAALKNFTAAGAILPAGTPNGYVILLVGFVQVVPPKQATVGIAVMLEAVVDRECVPAVKVVEVIVRFQPAPFPLASVTVSPSE